MNTCFNCGRKSKVKISYRGRNVCFACKRYGRISFQSDIDRAKRLEILKEKYEQGV